MRKEKKMYGNQDVLSLAEIPLGKSTEYFCPLN